MSSIPSMPLIEKLVAPFSQGVTSINNHIDSGDINKLTASKYSDSSSSNKTAPISSTTVNTAQDNDDNDSLSSLSNIPLDRELWRPSAQSMKDSVLWKFIQFLDEQPAKRFQAHSKPAFLSKLGPDLWSNSSSNSSYNSSSNFNSSYSSSRQQQRQKQLTPSQLHQALHEWSIADDSFWGFVWDFLQIKCSKPYDHVKMTPTISATSTSRASLRSQASSPTNSVLSHQFIETRFFVGARMNYAENMLRMCHVDALKNKEALVFIGESSIRGVELSRQSITYSQLWEKVAKLAHYLRNHVGLKKMDRVVALLPNCIETVVALLAVTSIGAIWSSVSPDLGKKIISDRFKQIQPTLLFTCEFYAFNGKVHCTNDTVEYLISHLPSLRTIIGVQLLQFTNHSLIENHVKLTDIIHRKNQRGVASRMRRGTDLEYASMHDDIFASYDNGGGHNSRNHHVMNVPRLEFEQVSAQHPIFIMYTSGTTGKPKCICQGFGVLVNHLKETHMHCDVTSKDTVFVYTNAGWMMWNWMVSMCCTGATLILYDGSPLYPNENAMWDLIEREKVTFFGTSARYLSHLATSGVDLVRKTPTDLSKLRLITSTGSPLAPSTAAYVYKHLVPHVHLSSMSGGTDLNGCFAIGSPFLPVYPGELQCAGLGMNVQVLSDDGERIFARDGELACLNPFPSAPLFFWGEEDHDRYLDSYFSMFPGIWAQGDLAEQTPRFGFYVKGRSDSTLNPGGVRIGTGDYYDILQFVEEVQDSIVVGQRQPDGNERVILFVQLKGGRMINQALTDKIQATIRKHLSARHRPSVIAQVSGVPVNVNGKKMEKLVKKLSNADPVAPSEISSLKNPECMPEFLQKNWNTGLLNSRL